jgi:uroporphyrinogen decarboxylase
MAAMTSRERVMTVLKGQVPDRIPHFEWIIDQRVREVICPGGSMEEFTVRMGLDAMLTAPDYQSEQLSPDTFKNEWGCVVEKGQEQHSTTVQGPIKTLDDFKSYTPPDPYAAHRYDSLKKMVAKYKGQYAIGVHLNDVLSLPRNLMGFEQLMMAFAQPELIKGLVVMSVKLNIKLAQEAARLGADFVFTGDDYASTEAMFISPAMFEEYLYPGLKEVIAGFHECGMPVIKHTDGNITAILDMLIDSGIDCLDPIDPVAGMDIARIKAKYGERVAIKGNVDCAHTLTFGSVEDVIKETLEVIKKAADGGGFILSSSNSIHSAVKPANYLAMLNTVRAYGNYPIKLDFDSSGAGEAFS